MCARHLISLYCMLADISSLLASLNDLGLLLQSSSSSLRMHFEYVLLPLKLVSLERFRYSCLIKHHLSLHCDIACVGHAPFVLEKELSLLYRHSYKRAHHLRLNRHSWIACCGWPWTSLHDCTKRHSTIVVVLFLLEILLHVPLSRSPSLPLYVSLSPLSFQLE